MLNSSGLRQRAAEVCQQMESAHAVRRISFWLDINTVYVSIILILLPAVDYLWLAARTGISGDVDD